MNIQRVSIYEGNYSKNRYRKTGIVFHWMDGNLEGTTSWFKNPESKASATFGIGKTGKVYQYMDDECYAFANGNTDANKKYISIEHEGGNINGKIVNPTKECLNASVELCRILEERHGFKLIRGVNAFKHNEVSNKYTQCSGTLDIDYIISSLNNPIMDFNEFIKWNDQIETNGLVSDKFIVQTDGSKSKLVNKINDLTEDQKNFLMRLKKFNDEIPESVKNTEWLDTVMGRYGGIYLPRSISR